MTLRAKLTIGSVLLAAFITGLISAVNLASDLHRQIDATLDRAELLKKIATKLVVQSLNNQQRTVPMPEALRDRTLAAGLLDLIAPAHSSIALEIAVLSPENVILADSDPSRLGVYYPPFQDFRQAAGAADLQGGIRILREKDRFYQLEEALESPDTHDVLLKVRVVVAPAFIRDEVIATVWQNVEFAALSILGAAVVTLLFSAIAFRPLGELGRMLDLAAQGESTQDAIPAPKPEGRDEVSIIASKVSLLGERLRGAQSEASDLRGNFERLLQDLEDAVLVFNREHRLVFASGSLHKFLGHSRAELMGELVTTIFPPEDSLGRLISQSVQSARPIRNRRGALPTAPGDAAAPDALVSVDILEATPGAPNSGTGMLVRLRDPEISRRLGRELQTADRMAAISRITSGVAHEVKNPLNAMLLHIEVARAKLAAGHINLEPQMDIISSEILRLDRVVKTFLDFTRPVELNLSDVWVEAFVGELVDLARPQAAAAGISIDAQLDVDGASVRIDRDLMKQALLNIVVNAIEAMPEGGRLTVGARTLSDLAEITIADTGSGIAPQLRDKIFRLYFTTKPSGSGIGLAMTYRIVQLHDGTIDFTSEPGKGTKFVLRLLAGE